MAGLLFKIFARQKPLLDALHKEFAPYVRDAASSPNSASDKAAVEIYDSDIFTTHADALVSPANSFGFMDGGFDDLILKHAGLQLQRRLQTLIRSRESGELLVGRALVLEMVADSQPANDDEWDGTAYLSRSYPESPPHTPLPFRYLIAAPTMRLPLEVPDTINAYLAFRAVILAVIAHNESVAPSDPSGHTTSEPAEAAATATATAKRSDASPIRSVACTGLCTGVGRMPADRCARQMRIAFEQAALGVQVSAALPPPGAPRGHTGERPPKGSQLYDYFDVYDLLLK